MPAPVSAARPSSTRTMTTGVGSPAPTPSVENEDAPGTSGLLDPGMRIGASPLAVAWASAAFSAGVLGGGLGGPRGAPGPGDRARGPAAGPAATARGGELGVADDLAAVAVLVHVGG